MISVIFRYTICSAEDPLDTTRDLCIELRKHIWETNARGRWGCKSSFQSR